MFMYRPCSPAYRRYIPAHHRRIPVHLGRDSRDPPASAPRAQAKWRSAELIDQANKHAQRAATAEGVVNDWEEAQRCYTELLDLLPPSCLSSSR